MKRIPVANHIFLSKVYQLYCSHSFARHRQLFAVLKGGTRDQIWITLPK